MVVPPHKSKVVMKTCQDHGTPVAHIQWLLLSNCLLLLQEVFLNSVLSKYQQVVSEGDTVCRWESHIETKIQIKVSSPAEVAVAPIFVKVLILGIFEDELKSFEQIEVNMNSEEIYTEGLPLFCVVPSQDAVTVMCKILQKDCYVVLVSCLSYFSFSTSFQDSFVSHYCYC